MLGVTILRLLIISDSHGRVKPVERAINEAKADAIIFLGDGIRPVMGLQSIYYDKVFYFVKGNCDFISCKATELLEANGKKVFFTHGHLYNVKTTYEKIEIAAKQNKADIALFGHTHIPYQQYNNGLHLLNPGSLSHSPTGKLSYGIVDIVDKNIKTKIIYL